jgi:hypothetical protein
LPGSAIGSFLILLLDYCEKANLGFSWGGGGRLVLTYGSSCVVITPQCQVLMLVQRRGSRFGVSAGAQQAMLDRNQVRDVVGIGGARATAPSLPEAPTSIWAGLQRG